MFDDSRLDDVDALHAVDDRLREIATAGARIRVDARGAEAVLAAIRPDQPRAVLAVGPESRLIRALLEPGCPVPVIAWHLPTLPGWVGPLDLVVVLAPDEADPTLAAALAQAQRRGCHVVVAAPEHSPIAEIATARDTVRLPLSTSDPLAAALVAAQGLERLGIGPDVDPWAIATACDEVAVACAARLDIAENPAKALACALGDRLPLVWGGPILAARASRRIAEALRAVSGGLALAGEVPDLLPLLEAARPWDRFADAEPGPRPVLVVLDDGEDTGAIRRARAEVESAARRHDVRVEVLASTGATPLQHYVSLLLQGWFAAAFLQAGYVDNDESIA